MTNLWRCTCGRLVNRFVNDSCPNCSRELPGAVAGEPTSDVCPTCELERIGGKCLTRWCADRDPSVDELVGGPRELRTDGSGHSSDDTEQVALTRSSDAEIVEGIRDGGIKCPDCRSDVAASRGGKSYRDLQIDGWYCDFCNNIIPAKCDATASAYVDGWTGWAVEFRDGSTRYVPVLERYVEPGTERDGEVDDGR